MSNKEQEIRAFQEGVLVKVFLFVLIAFIIYAAYEIGTKMYSLNENIEYTNAVIVDFPAGVRARRYIEYKFFVNNKEYHDSGKYYPKSDTLSIGDTIAVVYDRTNPDNSRTYRDYKQGMEW